MNVTVEIPDHRSEDKNPQVHAALKLMIDLYRTSTGATQETASMAADLILAVCPNDECSICAMICCPHGDEMHLHHDGCPSCH